MQTEISRFNLWPKRDPRGYMVGFNITTANGHTFYKETLVPLSEAGNRTEEEIAELAWSKIEEEIVERVLDLESRGRIIGQKFYPDVEKIEQVRQKVIQRRQQAQTPPVDDEDDPAEPPDDGGGKESPTPPQSPKDPLIKGRG